MLHRLVSISSFLQLLQYNNLVADLYGIAERNLINLLSVTRSEELNQTYDIHIHRSKLHCWLFLSSRRRKTLPNIVMALMDKGIYRTQASTRDNSLSCQLSPSYPALAMYNFELVYIATLEHNLQMLREMGGSLC